MKTLAIWKPVSIIVSVFILIGRKPAPVRLLSDGWHSVAEEKKKSEILAVLPETRSSFSSRYRDE